MEFWFLSIFQCSTKNNEYSNYYSIILYQVDSDDVS